MFRILLIRNQFILDKMGTCDSTTVQTRGKIDLVYSTTSGNSKGVADKLQKILEDNKYLVNLINIGDYDYEQLLDSELSVIFLLSTYGDGNSPSDGEKFYDWIHSFKPDGRLTHLSYAIIAFGNSSFENHCGFGLKTQKFLKQGGANEILQITLCDAAKNQKNSKAKFPGWSQKLIEILNGKHQIQNIKRQNLGSSYVAKLENKPNYQWELQVPKISNIRKEFTNYYQMYKAKVISIKELRKNKEADRSTIHVRLQIDKNVELWPACNVQVFPINLTQSKSNEDDFIVTFNELKGKVPFPPMPLKQIKKIINLTQNSTHKQIKTAILLSNAPQAIQDQYRKQLGQAEIQIQSKKVYEDLQPKTEFLPKLGLNTVRIYTLSSWDPQHKYLDLCVSLVKNGLTSEYLKTYPQYLRIKSVPSTFYIPEDKRPIVMIANGSGIAPFRSIAQYVGSLPAQKRNYLRLYYGIQNEQNDYYFGDQWKELESKKIVEVRLAQSRKDPNKKQYVQNILQKDVQWLTDHLFNKNGVIFICGGVSMSKDINNVIFKSVTLHAKVPYKAYTLSNQLKQQKVIVEEIFG